MLYRRLPAIALVLIAVAVALGGGAARSSAAGGSPAYSASDLGTLGVDFKYCTYVSAGNDVSANFVSCRHRTSTSA